jgi:hypothetical protein
LEENDRCTQYEKELNELGMYLVDIYTWVSKELEWVLAGARDLMRAAGWSIDDFKQAMGGAVALRRERNSPNKGGFQNGDVITFWNGAFDKGEATAKYVVVHELAHQWDETSGGRLSSGLVKATGGSAPGCLESIGGICVGKYRPGDTVARPYNNDYYATNKYEDFAESVAATVEGPGNPKYRYSKRDLYVREQFYKYGGYPNQLDPPPPQRAT